MDNVKNLIAKDLLSIKAVFLRPDEPFTWASGIKSPIYCDNRLTLTAPEVRTHVEEGLAEVIKREYPDVEVLMGTSTAGIAHAAIVGHIMNLPMGYVRSGNKDHGRQNQIEGKLEKGQKVVVVEDLISTGGSCIEVVNVLREAGAEVLGIVSIFTYGMKKGIDRLAAAGVKNVVLQVAGAFHSPFMTPAREKLAEFVKDITFNKPAVPVLSNATGTFHAEDGEAIKAAMLTQVDSPVHFSDCVKAVMPNGGIFAEFGPGKVLSGLIRRIDKANAVTNVQDTASLTATVTKVNA